ncbi:polysaccharide biosynthesis tyrosine autokinase [Variovorax sp.]|uniref:polysaccharide biosynthesis tyrosine autokinase n=1 Tax=Variovorax sp. TaxID=1871043 RepID=UPI002D730AEF|nr:polysaccharide biosynthesis tyrosine autokinase [Variovorax sp.]HYP84725.1 polysaccharide biosynthesis tyrosine autokinase [Variovorax sp.]
MSAKLTHSGLGPMNSASPFDTPEAEVDVSRYVEALVSHKWMIVAITVTVTLLGVVYALLQRPVYEATMLVQVEDSEGASRNVLGEASTLLDAKTPAAAEIEIIRSRSVIGAAADATQAYVSAMPRYAPYVGGWLARRASGLSEPGFLGMPGYVTGTERIAVERLETGRSLEGVQMTITAQGGGRFELTAPNWPRPIEGEVGSMLKTDTPNGPIELKVSVLDGRPGAQFLVSRGSRQATIDAIQGSLSIYERSKQSGIVAVSLQDGSPPRLVQLLNVIGAQYVQQNINRRAAEAQKSLAFLDVQLPAFKRQLEQSEEAFNRFRNLNGSVSIDDEGTQALGLVVERQSKLFEAQQRRTELAQRFTSAHPVVQTLDAQIAALKSSLSEVQARIRAFPQLQQEAVRLERDVRVNSELYRSLLNNAMQLRLVKEGKVGNVRVLDEAVEPMLPIKPRRTTIVAAALALGLFLGVMAALLRNMLVEHRIRDAYEVEAGTGMAVFSAIPFSTRQATIAQRRLTGPTGVRLLAVENPDDSTVESLRSMRTALQFAMLEAPSNRVMITGPTPGVGKSFVTANFAALLAASGKKTLLIDADLRRGRLHQYLGLQRHGGLSELIAGSLTIQQTVHKQVTQNLDFLATGQLPPNPGELLTSDSFANVMKRLSEQYDIVVIDTPPVLVASDASSTAVHAGTVLMVAKSDMSTMGEIKESMRRLSLGGKTAAGVLLNGVDNRRRSYGNRMGRYSHADYGYESILPEHQ